MDTVLHVLEHALIDTLKTLPFLFLAYLLIEYIEHRASDKFTAMLSRFGRFSPAAGAVTGIIPQCGFSVTAARLYTGRLISFGTLAAVFIATSDEAIPILLSHPDQYSYIWKLIVVKLVVATAAGFFIDAVFQRSAPSLPQQHNHAHDEIHAGCGNDECEHGILKPALRHTALSALYIFIVLLILEIVVVFVGEAAIASLFTRSLALQPVFAALVGFVPNCASSIVLTEMFASGVLSFGSLMAGLVTNAGVAYAVLFRTKENFKQNLLLIGIIFVVGIATGYIIQLF